MRHATKLMRAYLTRFIFRALVLLYAAAMFIARREALDFTGSAPFPRPVDVLWLILAISFARQLSPHSRVSRGCLKQFPVHFEPTAAPVDPQLFRAHLRRLDRGAAGVALVWIAFNLVFFALYLLGILGVPFLVLLTAFYYVCDLICVLFYCPFQSLLMKNKCCATCRIFAWGTIMIATPLIFVPHLWSWSLAALALVCTVLWEAAYRRHPERFAEETNVYLTCEHCTDKLCAIKRRGASHP